jgi:uncharacterized membrane protein
MEDALIDGLFMASPLLIVGGLVAQWQALRRFEGLWRLAAWVPAAAMGAALAAAVLGVVAGSNLAPIWVVFALPPCLLWLAALWLLRGIARLLAI